MNEQTAKVDLSTMPIDQVEGILSALADRVVSKISSPVKPLESMTFGELFALYYKRHVKVRLRN
jgi:hypothetical protein